MGSLAGLLEAAGHRVSGSDRAFHPPMGPALERWGVELMEGYDPAHLDPAPDLVVIGNVCRPDHPEARAAIERGLPTPPSRPRWRRTSSRNERPSSSPERTARPPPARCSRTCSTAPASIPGMLVGGIPRDFDAQLSRSATRAAPSSSKATSTTAPSSRRAPSSGSTAPRPRSSPRSSTTTSTSTPTRPATWRAFEGFVERLPPDGVLVAWAGSPLVRAVAKKAPCRVRLLRARRRRLRRRVADLAGRALRRPEAARSPSTSSSAARRPAP